MGKKSVTLNKQIFRYHLPFFIRETVSTNFPLLTKQTTHEPNGPIFGLTGFFIISHCTTDQMRPLYFRSLGSRKGLKPGFLILNAACNLTNRIRGRDWRGGGEKGELLNPRGKRFSPLGGVWGQRNRASWSRKVLHHLLIRALKKNMAIKDYTGFLHNTSPASSYCLWCRCALI